MAKSAKKPPTQRQLRVGEMLRHELAWILERGELSDPRLAGVTLTVTEVSVSPDLKNAMAYVVPLGGGDPGDSLKGLGAAEPYMRRLIAKKVDLRAVPRLRFQIDHTFDEAGKIDALLHDPRVLQDLAAKNEDDDGSSA